MKKTLRILFGKEAILLLVTLLCSAQIAAPDTIKKDSAKIETPKQNTDLGEAIQRTNRAEAIEALELQKLAVKDSI